MKEKNEETQRRTDAQKIALYYLEEAEKLIGEFDLIDLLGLDAFTLTLAYSSVARSLCLIALQEDIEKLGREPRHDHATLKGIARFSPIARFESRIWTKEFALQTLDAARQNYLQRDDAPVGERNQAGIIDSSIQEFFSLMQPGENSDHYTITSTQLNFWGGTWKAQLGLAGSTVESNPEVS